MRTSIVWFILFCASLLVFFARFMSSWNVSSWDFFELPFFSALREIMFFVCMRALVCMLTSVIIWYLFVCICYACFGASLLFRPAKPCLFVCTCLWFLSTSFVCPQGHLCLFATRICLYTTLQESMLYELSTMYIIPTGTFVHVF